MARQIIVFVLGAGSIAALIGIAIAELDHRPVASTIGYALLIGGALLVFLAAGSGSPSERSAVRFQVLGGRFAGGGDAALLPQSPFAVVIGAAAVAAIGVAILVG